MNNYSKDERSVEAENLANELLTFVNSYGHDSKTFAETIAHGHKTLQQSFMRLMILTMKELAEVNPDERNAATVNLAKEVMKLMENRSLPLI